MRKQTHFKKVVSLAVAAAMAVSVCTAALADNAPNEANGQPPVSEQQVEEEPSENDVAGLSLEEDDKEADDGTTNDGTLTVAAGGSGKNYLSIQAAINAGETTIGIPSKDVTESFTVPVGSKVLLVMNGGTITNTAGQNTITNKGELTISGVGTVDNISHGKAALYNAPGATATLNGCTFTRSQEKGSSADNNGGNSYYTIQNLGTMTINQGVVVNQGADGNGKYSSLVANGWYDGTQNTTGAEAKMIINDGTFSGGLNTIKNDDYGVMEINGGNIVGFAQAAMMNNNVATITGGTFDGSSASNAVVLNYYYNDTMDKGELSISGGTFITSDNVPFLRGRNDAKGKVSITNGNFSGGIKGVQANTISISGGTFAVKPDESYLAEDYTVEEKDGKFNVVKKVVATPTPAPTATPEPTATPAPTAAPTATPAPTAAPVEVKPAAPVVNDTALKDVTTEERDKLVKAAESATISESKELANNETVQNVAKSADEYIADDGTVKDTLKEDIQKAVDASPELKAAAANDISDITLVSAPYLAVTPQKSEDGTLVFDIKLYCALKATTEPDNMTAANTCTLKTEKVEDAPVMNITLDVSKAYSGNDLNTLYVRHVTESGAVYYYKAYSKGNGIIEFTNPHGFSTFTVLSDTRVAKVKLAGKEYGYDIAGIGVEFPHPDMPGYTYKGYQFDGISGSYTTLTEELFNKLAAAGKTVSATATFSAIATPAPAATAAPEATAAPTATPDDSQYYTCKDCGHHNWTATADGYKCDTCGRIETKQLSGYKNVKGTYTPTASAAAAKTTSAIPQTSDTMPIVPIAIVMIAALLGLGVTLYMKKKKN